MNSSILLSISTYLFGLAAVFYIAALVFKSEKMIPPGKWTVFISVVCTTTGLILRWIESYKMGIGHAPMSNLYESLVFFSWTIGVIYMVMEYKYKNPLIGAFAMPLAFLSLAYASLSPNINDKIQPLIPALKSNWLIAHVIACFFGYAAFAIACGVSVMYLIKSVDKDEASGILGRFPSLNVLDELTHQMVLFGFLFLTVGIITGSVWANSAWGSYWSWDPKETWSLITWFVYAILLHARLMRGWEGRRIAYISIVGFAAVLFTYFGVNYLPGLHSYGAS